ncbi:hypothetical protein ATG_02840 [Desulfurococcaceae archaeon AG1]|nr:MAG: hypothetical protein DJ555_03465 [Desulfurococcaceae archaeon]GAY25081.1 hypothetical protein ATG_02840 [Desulfurococcaceae archaeon AG1]
MKAQSELIGSVILITLTMVLGAAGFLLASSWALSRYSENAFITYAELASNEFLVLPISFENRGSYVVVYVGVIRIGVLQDDYYLYISIHGASSYAQRWWDLPQLSPSIIGYNVSSPEGSPHSLSFNSLDGGGVGISVSRLYAKYTGSWYSLRDLGAFGVLNIYGVGVLSIDRALFLNITVPRDYRYMYIVLWVGYEDKYIATPFVISIG